MRLSEFDYALPKDRIAQQPVDIRDQSRLMVIDRESGSTIAHRQFKDIVEYFDPGDLLVVNETRVTAQRIHGRRESGGAAELFLTHRIADGCWQALVKPGKNLRVGATVDCGDRLIATITGIVDERGSRLVQFTAGGNAEGVDKLVDEMGRAPLPPYIADHGEDQSAVKERYQTVYAREPGSAAAPTAGLHFTPDLLGRLEKSGVRIAHLTLHVGVGTFLPIVSENVAEHVMHAERVTIPDETAKAIGQAKGRITAVGTTVLRALESAAVGDRAVKPGSFDTSLFVTPGYRFQVVDSLVTNFHMPRSTLLVLVASFFGREAVLAAYDEALREGYRFLSFGDAMFIRSVRNYH